MKLTRKQFFAAIATTAATLLGIKKAPATKALPPGLNHEIQPCTLYLPSGAKLNIAKNTPPIKYITCRYQDLNRVDFINTQLWANHEKTA